MYIGGIIFLALLIFVVYNIFDTIRIVAKWYFGDYINQYLLLHDLDPLYRKPLELHSRYYQLLSPDERKIFEKRVQKFISQKQFIARGFDRVTDEMKALIAGTAIQLTFGLPSVYLRHFKRILVYQDSYYSEISKRYHKGEVNVGGIIVLSWKSFLDGIADNTDGRNLGLHEIAHALRLENAIRNDEFGFLDQKLLTKWTSLCYEEIERISLGNGRFFRQYAATDSQEFFAVAVENFFERPVEFHAYQPELYRTLAAMLNQDPLLKKVT